MAANFFRRVLRWGRIAIAVTAMSAALSPAASQAFTLIPVTKLYVNPNAGYTTSLVQVRGTYQTGSCSAASLTFSFLFDSKPLWTKTALCNPKTVLWDTGWSAYTTPPVPRTVGKHLISLSVSSAVAVIGSANFTYSIYPAPASPRTQSSPTPSPTPTPDCATGAAVQGCPSPTSSSTCPPGAVCASPSSGACPAAMLPPPGTGGWADNLIAGAMVLAVLPIAGLALFGLGPLLAAINRRRRLLMLLGLSAVVSLTVMSCDFPAIGGNSNPSPSTSPSTSSCSAA